MIYNGWHNYETWCINLWLTNEQSTYEYWFNQINKSDEPIHQEAQAMKEEIEELLDNHLDRLSEPLPDIFIEFIKASLSEVDWLEIAESFKD